ncbi:MAG: ABC transporter permease [Candidatus Bathyarchaeia archaeon]
MAKIANMWKGAKAITLAPFMVKYFSSCIIFVIALSVVTSFLWALGYDPAVFFTKALKNAITTDRGMLSALTLATPLIFTGLGWIVAARTGVAYLGVEGVVHVSALGALAVGGLLEAPGGLHHLLIWFASALCGVVWALLPGILKAFGGIHEVVTSLMLNWVAIYLTGFVVSRLLRDPAWPMFSVQIKPSGRLYPLVGISSLTVFIFVAILFAFMVYILLEHTRVGLRMRATGYAEFTTKSLGVNTSILKLLSFVLAGVLGSCAGFALTAGMPPYWRITDTAELLAGHGFAGISVAAIALRNPILTIVAAILFGLIQTAVKYAQIYMRIPAETTYLVFGTILMLMALPEVTKVVLASKEGRRDEKCCK